jgi:hemolysin D
MNELQPSKAPVVRSSPQLPAKDMRRADLAFLPEALEVIETPADPAKVWFLHAICLMFFIGLAWSYFGYLEVFAVAPGKVQTAGRTKLVQPFDPGQVVALHVQNGQRVKAGDVLVELDPTEEVADQRLTRVDLHAARAEVARRRQAIASAQAEQFDRVPQIAFSDGIPEDIRRREELVLRSDLAQLASMLESLKAKRRQSEAELEKTRSHIGAQKAVLQPMTERYRMRDELLRTGVASRATYLDSQQEVAQAEATLVTLQGSAVETEAAIEVLRAEIVKTRETFVSDNANKLAEVERRVDAIEQRLAKASAKVERKTLTAPISGTVQALTVINLNQVVSPGQELMRIIPDGLPLEIEAYVLNSDIGFVREGQPAVIKIDSFPFTRYGTIEGVVTRVATDAISGGEAARNQVSPAPSSTIPPIGGPSGSGVTTAAQKAQDLVYQVIIQPSATSMMIDGRMMPLSPGMSVSVDIKTEDRRVIDYILSPLIDVGSSAMRER